MNPRLLSLLSALVILVTGCATNGPVYQLPKDTKAGALVGRNFMVFIPTDKVRISFVEIDGALVKPSVWTGPLEEVPIAPGPHKITYGLEGFQFVLAQDEMELNVEAGHRYKFNARKVGIAFDVEVKDDSSDGIVFTKRVTGTKGAAPAVIPIFIPTK